MEVTNRFKRLDPIEYLKYDEVHHIAQEAVTETIPKKKKCDKEKWLPRKEEKQKTMAKRKDIPI